MLKERVFTGVIIALLYIILIIFSDISFLLNAVIIALSFLSVTELYKIADIKMGDSLYFISLALSVMLAFVTLPPDLIFALFAIVLLGTIVVFVRHKDIKEINPSIMVLLAFVVKFFYRTIFDIREMENGLVLMVFALLTPVICDISAYFIGRAFGKHKLAPTISPKKTIEGAIGGTATTVLVWFVIGIFLNKYITIDITVLIIYAVLASIIGQIGDLAFSSIKRIAKIKDFGNILPGHGGILDRFDSLLYVLPFTYCFFSFISIF